MLELGCENATVGKNGLNKGGLFSDIPSFKAYCVLAGGSSFFCTQRLFNTLSFPLLMNQILFSGKSLVHVEHRMIFFQNSRSYSTVDKKTI